MLRSNAKQNLVAKALLVVVSVGLTAVGKYWGVKIMGEGPPLIFFVPCVMFCAFFGGFWTGIISIILSGLVSIYVFMGPSFDFRVGSRNDYYRLALFGCVSFAICYLFEYLNSQKFKLAQLNKTKDRFIATLGHELRVPLNRISLLAEQQLVDTDLSQSVRQAFEQILRNNEIEQVLIRDVLDMARATAHKLTCKFEDVDLIPLIYTSLSIVEGDFLKKNITVLPTFSHKEIYIHADRIRIKQVLWNLLRNAVKFSPQNAIIHVQVNFDEASDKVTIDVRDHGVGIESPHLQSIFQPFFQLAKAPRSKEPGLGLGLGLAICKEIVHEHGGTIWAESEGLHKGSAFKVRLGAQLKKPSTARPAAAMDDEALTSGGGMRVLLIDDDPLALQLLSSRLCNMGYACVTVSGCQEAKRKNPESFDAVISDFNLSDGNGWDVLNHFRLVKPELPVIALSGSDLSNLHPLDSKFSFDDQLVKPVSFSTLQQLLMTIKNRRDANAGRGSRRI